MYALIDGRISFKSINALTLFPSFFFMYINTRDVDNIPIYT